MAKTRLRRKLKNHRQRATTNRSREVVGIVVLGIAIFLFAALISLHIGGGHLMGPFGRTSALVVYAIFGLSAYFLAAGLFALAVRLLLDREPIVKAPEAFGLIVGMVSLSSLAHLLTAGWRVSGHSAGGWMGETTAEVLRALVSTPGTILFCLVGLFLAVIIATPLTLFDVLGGAGKASRFGLHWGMRGTRGGIAALGRGTGSFVRAVLPERERDEYGDETALEKKARASKKPIIIADKPARAEAVPEPAADVPRDTDRMEIISLDERRSTKKKGKRKTLPGLGGDAQPVEEAPPVAVVNDAVAMEPDATSLEGEPMIVESRFRHVDATAMRVLEQELDQNRKGYIPLGDGEYQMPPIHLLNYDDSQNLAIDRTAMLELSARLTQTLKNYGVSGEVTAIRPGPVVTMYEFAPAAGTRLSKIEGLADEIAMVLEALRIRIVAPIPGKAVVGIEVPNRHRENVFLKEIVADKEFQRAKWRLPLALGKTIEGAPAVCDLASMPHLLVAGTTGSGKSVSINAMIASLLYNATPEDVRLIMVDPKMLELSVYEGIPHLLLPVVTDPKKANLALRWAVEEMDRRYQLLSEVGARDIVSYNKKVAKLLADNELEEVPKDEFDEADVHEEDLPRKLPYIVVVIDEFADLMMQAPKDVENSVARIAQKARASGIHLILATQRPSTNVITGLIKANFPSRIAFHVVTKVDSRVVLDQHGAEALLGMGDMLFSDTGSAPRRLHGCYVGEDEIERLVAFLKQQGRPVYNLDILNARDEEGDGDFEDDEPADEKYDLAVRIVAETRRATISYLQRRLGVGYNKAAKMIERMERDGIVSAPDAKKVREVLVPPAA